MSETTGRPAGSPGPGEGWPFTDFSSGGGGRPIAPAPTRAAPSPPQGEGAGRPDPGDPRARRRRLVLVVVAAVVVLAVAATAFALSRRTPAEPPAAEVVTLPAPTPTVEPIERAPGTPFFEALPSVVRAHALSDAAEDLPLLTAGALEAYRLGYTDGATPVVLVAAQWPSAEEATAAYDRAVAAAVAAGGAEPAEEGPVEVDGTEVGRRVLVPGADGTAEATLTWRNGDTVLQLVGPAEALPDLFAAFPL